MSPRGGSLVYVKGTEFSGFASRALVWVDRAGNEEPLEAPVLAYERPRVSPDGTRVAVDVADPEDPRHLAPRSRARDGDEVHD